jgi:hypothetical protein
MRMQELALDTIPDYGLDFPTLHLQQKRETGGI